MVAITAVLLMAFSLVAIDVNWPESAHILSRLDAAARLSAVSATSASFRSVVADKVVSNVPIGAAAPGAVCLAESWCGDRMRHFACHGLNFYALWLTLRTLPEKSTASAQCCPRSRP